MSHFLSVLTAASGMAVFHGILPNHWLPFLAVGRSRDWPASRTLAVTAVAATGHILVTAALGLALSWGGRGGLERFGERFHVFAASLLIGFGIGFIVADLTRGHRHQHAAQKMMRIHPRVGDLPLIGTLLVYLTLAPCEALLPVFFASYALTLGQRLIAAVVVAVLTVGSMVTMVWLALKGFEGGRLRALEERELMIFGVILLGLGVFALVRV